jgi:hypothetical protein
MTQEFTTFRRPQKVDYFVPVGDLIENRFFQKSDKILLPLPPEATDETRFEMEIYARFMSHLRQVPNSKAEIKVLSSIQFTADMLDTSDALVAKTLVDLGLRAPRKAFPASFLDFVTKSMARSYWQEGGANTAVQSLHDHWNGNDEHNFSSSLQTDYAVHNENIYVTT